MYMLTCEHVWDVIRRNDRYRLFWEPVDQVVAPDYFTVITEPMDLSVIKTKMVSKYYNPEEFVEDMLLMFRNAMQYNPVGHVVHQEAARLRRLFLQYCDRLPLNDVTKAAVALCSLC